MRREAPGNMWPGKRTARGTHRPAPPPREQQQSGMAPGKGRYGLGDPRGSQGPQLTWGSGPDITPCPLTVWKLKEQHPWERPGGLDGGGHTEVSTVPGPLRGVQMRKRSPGPGLPHPPVPQERCSSRRPRQDSLQDTRGAGTAGSAGAPIGGQGEGRQAGTELPPILQPFQPWQGPEGGRALPPAGVRP